MFSVLFLKSNFVAYAKHCNELQAHGFKQQTNARSALLAHIASRNMRAVSDTFRHHEVPPPPAHKPNMNENRSHNNMLGPLRSPPPAAK